MKTIEERAKEYKKRYFSKANDLFQSVAKVAYIVGAEEQKVIDIDKACDWLKNNWREYVYQDRDGMILFGNWESNFRKALEK